MWRNRFMVMALSLSLLFSAIPLIHASEDREDTNQQGEFDFFVSASDISFSPSHMVYLNDNVGIQAEVTRAGDQWSIDWTKEGLNIPLGGGGDDDVHMVSPRVIHENGTYKMWYGGATGLGRVYEIFYATSPDGFTWTKFGIVLTTGSPGDLDDQKVCLHYVIKEGGVYKMWYSGADDYISSGGVYRIFYATSNDGTTWNKQGLVLDVDPPGSTDARMLRSPVVLNESGLYKMWYTGTDASNTDRIHYATSPDGVSWTKHGVVLDKGSPGDYDETGAGWSFVWRSSCGYTMLYTGRQSSEFRVLEAVSSDGIEWLKRGLVVDLGPDPQEDTRIDDVFVLFNGSIPERMWYAAIGTNYQIFTASPTLTNLTTSASVAFYLDAINPPNLIEEHVAMQFPICGCRVASTNWTASLLGVHEIIVVVDRLDQASESNESNNIASRKVVVMNPLVEADAGPDKIVNEGGVVELNASASRGAEEVQYWSDSFEDGSRISDLDNTSIQTGSIVLASLSFERTHLFDVDPGFVLLDDQPLTDIWWDQGNEVVRWHSDRDDPADTFERFVERLPFDVTDRYDIRADVHYLYTMAEPTAEVHPLLLKYDGSYRSTSYFGPTNNSLVYSLYGGNPSNDRHSLRFWDGSGAQHEPMNFIYDSQFNKLLHANMSFDSSTRVLYVELRDDVGTLVSSGFATIPSGSFKLTEFGVGAIGVNFGGVSEGYTDILSLRAYGYPDGNVTSVLINPQNMISWGALSFNTTEPAGTNVTVDVLDELGNPIVSGLRAGDSPVILTGLIDPVLYPRIRLKAMLSTGRNETPSLLDWGVSYVAGAPLASYYWDVNHLVDSDGDGNYTNDVDLDGQVVYHTYGDNGMYEVHLNATTDTNESFYDMCNVTVLNVLPSVIVTPPSTLEEGVQLAFDITASDPGSDDLTLMLDWGDGSNGSWTYYNDGMGPDPPDSPDVNPMSVVDQRNHTYGHAGVYTVNATVIDDDGGTTTLALQLNISNVKPTSAIDVSQPNPVAEGSSVLLGGYFDDPSWLDNHTVTWGFGDGQSMQGSFTPGVGFTHHVVDNVTHVYGDDGVFQVTLNVSDDYGDSDEVSVAITVLNQNPSANINCPSKVSLGNSFQCYTNATDPGSDDLTVDWDWDDGTAHNTTIYFNNGISPDPDPSPGPTYPFSVDDLAAHAYVSVGNYTIVLNVTDDDGGYTELQFDIEVVGPPETTIVIGNPQYISVDVFVTSSTPISFIVWDRSGTGIESTYYRVNGGSWVRYLSPFSISAEGPHIIYFNSTDMLGGAETTKNFSLIVDDTPPSSTITVGTPNYTDVDLWIAPSTPLTITSIDASCGLSQIEYELDGGGWQTYSVPITVPIEGSHVLLYRGVDNLGNTEIPQTLTFWVDGTPPVSSVIVGTPNYTSVNLWISPSTTLEIVSVDSGSGLSYIEYELDGGGWQNYTMPITVPAEGSHVLQYRGVDNLGFVENQQSINFWVDATPPYSDIFVGAPNYTGIDLWITPSTLLTITSIDDGSGITLIDYELDGGGWQTYTAPITVPQEGSHVLAYRGIDNLGYIEGPSSLTFIVDGSPPSSAVTIGTPSYTGVDLWISPSTTLTITSTDLGCGLSLVEYQLDGGSWQAYAVPMTIPDEGSHLLLYRGIDNLGNTEDPGSLVFWVDATPPTSDLTVGTPSYTGVDLWISPSTTLEITSADAGSGVSHIECQLDGGGWQTYTMPITVSQEGTHFIVYRGVDNLGYVEDPKSLVFVVDDAPPSSDLAVGSPSYTAADLWISPSTPLTISSIDGGCGLSYLEYQIDGDIWQTYTGPLTMQSEGAHTLSYRGVDNLGNVEVDRFISFIVDGTPPASSISIGEPRNDVTPVEVYQETPFTISSVDTGSGVRTVEIRIDSSAWREYTGSFNLTGHVLGIHTIEFRAYDNLDNLEDVQSITVDLIEPAAQEENLKPLIAIVFAIVLAIIGAMLALKRPFISEEGSEKKGFTFLAVAFPFVLAEIFTGILSLFVPAIEVPPWFGLGMILDLAILMVGLVVELVVFSKNKSPGTEEEEPEEDVPEDVDD